MALNHQIKAMKIGYGFESYERLQYYHCFVIGDIVYKLSKAINKKRPTFL